MLQKVPVSAGFCWGIGFVCIVVLGLWGVDGVNRSLD